MLTSQKLLQIAALPSSVFIILHNGCPLVVNEHTTSSSGRCSRTDSLMKLHYSAIASVVNEDNLVYLGTIKSLTDAESSPTTGEVLLENNQSSVSYFCIDLSKLSTDEVKHLGNNSMDTELIHPFGFVQLSSEDRMLYSRASLILHLASKESVLPSMWVSDKHGTWRLQARLSKRSLFNKERLHFHFIHLLLLF